MATDCTAEWQLCLYVAGQSPKSLRAIANIHRVCQEYIHEKYEIEVVDLVEHPSLARQDQILAIPTLIRRHPAPTRRVVGDLSDTERVLIGLQIDRHHA
jgi:circadian clock protein KaiB